MLEAMDALVEKGISHIALINGSEKLMASKQRLQIYLQGLKQNNIQHDERLIQSSDLSKDGNQEAMRPAAIIIFNDYLDLDGIVIAKKNNLVIN
ncbi:DNA-binding LacI/PurR family transcriptional regulator [Pedobacter sp. CG_S7]|uniref:hypothetical protein n=1 Tax=Pedobacter sp. CG_S7 TaxID=3143930 RepID=UPI003396EBE7